MRRLIFIIGLLLSVMIFLSACSGNDTANTISGTKPVMIQVESDPSPARMGDVTLTLMITDQNNQPIEGARVDVSVDHTDMTGMTMSGSATEQGGGKYAINANFSMSGNWKMTVYVRKDSLEYQEDIDLKIQ